MAAFVLVPGAWLGSWCWKKVVPYLRVDQHEVYTPTLTGLGERSHLATQDIDLNTHIQDVINVFEYEDLEEVILVGHSYSGMVVTGVVNRLPARVAHLVYLDAIVPNAGQSLFDDWSTEGRAAVEEEARLSGDDWRWPLPDDLEELSSLSGFTEADKQWMHSKAVAHPLKTFSQPLALSKSPALQIPRTYILCTAERTWFPNYVENARIAPEWDFYELPTGHWPMITMPRELAQLFLEIAKRLT